MEDRVSIVYLAKNAVNGGEYVGVSSRSLFVRRKEHLADARTGRGGCKAFHAAIRKYGPESFEWTVLAAFQTRELALEREVMEIAQRSPRYNITKGGAGVIMPRTPEWRAKISAANKGRKLTPEQYARLKAARPPSQGEKSVVCLEDQKWFSSIKAAGAFYGVPPRRISAATHQYKGFKRAAGKRFALFDEMPSEEIIAAVLAERQAEDRVSKANRSHRARAVVCINTGVVYQTGIGAAEANQLHQARIVQLCSQGGATKSGLRFRYADAAEVVRLPRSPEAMEASRQLRSGRAKGRRHPPVTIERMKVAAKKRGISAVTRKAADNQKRKPLRCIETGTIFPDAYEAGLAHGLARNSVYALVASGGKSWMAGVSFEHYPR